MPSPPSPEPGRPRRLAWVLAVLLVAGLAAGAFVVRQHHRADAGEPPPAPAAVETATLERRDLSTTRTLPGSIGFGAERPLSGHQDATVTWLPKVGATIKRGKQLFRADDEPVPLFYGSMPLYRDLAGKDLTGRDVQIVKNNLKALGYAVGVQPRTVGTGAAAVQVADDESVLTKDLVAAIKRWQQDIGRTVTGTIKVGDVEVLSGAVRVASLAGQPGGPANAELMAVTSTRKVITVATEPASWKRGTEVTVRLPDDRTARARISAVGRVLAPGDSGPPHLTLTITVGDPGALAGLDAADVEVEVAGKTAKDVLVAPIEALVALSEGGYAVQAPAGLVAVETGMFAGGWVEITGGGLTAGTEVVVSS